VASSLRRLISTLAIAAILAAGLPSAGFGGGSDEPGYTGGSSSSVGGPTGGNGSGSTSGGPAVGPSPIPTDPQPLQTQEQARAASIRSGQTLTNRLASWWLTLDQVLRLF
jgi:hypothetical protein